MPPRCCSGKLDICCVTLTINTRCFERDTRSCLDSSVWNRLKGLRRTLPGLFHLAALALLHRGGLVARRCFGPETGRRPVPDVSKALDMSLLAKVFRVRDGHGSKSRTPQ